MIVGHSSLCRGLFYYTRLPFEAVSALEIFQRTMDCLLRGFPRVAMYLNDILVTGETEHHHLQNLDTVLERLKTVGLRLNKSKCIFMAVPGPQNKRGRPTSY